MQIEKLASKIAERDKKSFEELYEQTSHAVYSVCLGILRNCAAAKEITQDTFVTVWESIGSYGGKGFKSWLMTIARNKALNALRQDKREVFVDFADNENLAGGYTIEEQAEEYSVLNAALKILPDDERQIVLMRNSGLKAKEISAILKIPRGTVSWKYSCALERMKKFLEEEQ